MILDYTGSEYFRPNFSTSQIVKKNLETLTEILLSTNHRNSPTNPGARQSFY